MMSVDPFAAQPHFILCRKRQNHFAGEHIMFRWLTVSGLFILGVLLAVTQTRHPAPAADAPVKEAPPAKKETSPVVALRTIVKGFPEIQADPKNTLNVILTLITRRMKEDYQLEANFEINMRAFEAEGIPEEKMLDFSPVAERPLRAESNISLASYLRRILNRLTEKGPVPSGATFVVRKNSIEITTNQMLKTQIWGDHQGPFLPLVYATFEKKPLEDVLKELAEEAECTIVLDPRVAEKARTPLTARFTNTPLDTAVNLLADMVELQPVFQDSVIYVTTPENALRLDARLKKDALLDPEKPGARRIGTGLGGIMPSTIEIPAPKPPPPAPNQD
jgi:hypothetical protein